MNNICSILLHDFWDNGKVNFIKITHLLFNNDDTRICNIKNYFIASDSGLKLIDIFYTFEGTKYNIKDYSFEIPYISKCIEIIYVLEIIDLKKPFDLYLNTLYELNNNFHTIKSNVISIVAAESYLSKDSIHNFKNIEVN